MKTRLTAEQIRVLSAKDPMRLELIAAAEARFPGVRVKHASAVPGDRIAYMTFPGCKSIVRWEFCSPVVWVREDDVDAWLAFRGQDIEEIKLAA